MIGRAGTGVDNVDVNAATKRGIVVVNAPESNAVAAAEHTLALALALCRNVPQAHSSLVGGDWVVARFAGNELYGKTLGVIGFGRIGQLVAHRAQAFAMEVVAFDKFVAAERFRELGCRACPDQRRPVREGGHRHYPSAQDARHDQLDRRRSDAKDEGRGADRQLRPRRAGRPRGASSRRSTPARSPGRRSTSSPSEPVTEHPLFGRDNVVVTPHLGAATAEAQDRAGTITADQVRRALTGGVVTNAVNIAAVRPEEMEALAPFVPLCEKLGRLAQGIGNGSIDRIVAEFRGRIADHDTRLLGIAVLVGILSGHTEEQVNLVNAPALAEERGIELTELKDTASDEFTELVTVRIESADDAVEVAGTAVGPRNLPHLVRVWGESFYMPFADHLVVFRYKDQPGMIGRIGTIFGQHSVNIASAAVGAEESGDQAVLALTTDAPLPEGVLDEILRLDGFHAGRAVDL